MMVMRIGRRRRGNRHTFSRPNCFPSAQGIGNGWGTGLSVVVCTGWPKGFHFPIAMVQSSDNELCEEGGDDGGWDPELGVTRYSKAMK